MKKQMQLFELANGVQNFTGNGIFEDCFLIHPDKAIEDFDKGMVASTINLAEKIGKKVLYNEDADKFLEKFDAYVEKLKKDKSEQKNLDRENEEFWGENPYSIK